jgi:hypothetical protein
MFLYYWREEDEVNSSMGNFRLMGVGQFLTEENGGLFPRR